MRLILLSALSLFLVSCASTKRTTVTSVEIKEIKPRYIEAESFKRIGEYFTGVENKGNRVIMRTDKDNRSGYYFTLVLDTKVKALATGAVFTGQFFTPASPDPVEYTFTLPAKRPKTKEVLIGLTGEQWPYGPDIIPSAWYFTIKDANDAELGSKKSYLWSF